jgi:hypothetical protein
MKSKKKGREFLYGKTRVGKLGCPSGTVYPGMPGISEPDLRGPTDMYDTLCRQFLGKKEDDAWGYVDEETAKMAWFLAIESMATDKPIKEWVLIRNDGVTIAKKLGWIT